MGYTGPCPPNGKIHTYVLTMFALDEMLDLEEGASVPELINAMEGHILEKAVLTGTYTK